MPRKRRDLSSSDTFHVLNRGIDDQDIFSIEDDWRFFEHLLGRAVEEGGIRIHAYALMSNHFHLVVGSVGSDLSGVMRDLQRRHASWFNRRTQRRGPLFEPRFVDVPIASKRQFHAATRYVHRNPIDIVGADALSAYRWSSLPAYLGRRQAPSWLCTAVLGAEIDGTTYLERVLEPSVDDLMAAGRRQPSISSSIHAIVCGVRKVLGNAADPAIDGDRLTALLVRDLRAADIVDMAAESGVSPAVVRQRAREAASLCHECAEARILRQAALEATLGFVTSAGLDRFEQ